MESTFTLGGKPHATRLFFSCPFSYEATARGCTDVDECASNRHDCKGSSECVNNKGGYTCVCPVGFQIDENRSCQDVNECNLYLCPFNSDCQNTPGSYRCVCKSGFRNVDFNSCEDIDECALTPGLSVFKLLLLNRGKEPRIARRDKPAMRVDFPLH